MDVAVEYTINLNGAVRAAMLKKALPIIKDLVSEQVELYLQDLEKHMGTIKGSSSYRDGAIHWQALDEDTIEEAPMYWYKTGKAKNSISVNIKMVENGISAFVGITEHAPGYQEALWNELGFTPGKGDTLVRRPLFFPLAVEHKAVLENKIRDRLAGQTIVLEI